MARKSKIPTPKINPKTSINLINNLSEKELLYRTVWNEAGGEGLLGMALVANSIFNRKDILDQGARLSLYQANDKTIKGILTGKNQFEPVTGNKKVLNPLNETEKQKVIEAIELAGDKRLLENKIKEEIDNISNNDILSLLNSTGFRGSGAKLDKSQNVNVVKYKGHKFNTAGNKDRKLVELEIDRNTPIPTEKPTQEKSRSIIDFVKGLFMSDAEGAEIDNQMKEAMPTLTDEEERIRALNNRKLSDIEARMDQEDMEYLADDKERRPLDVTETTNEDGTTTTKFNVPPPSSARSSLDQQMSDLDFGDLRDAPGSKRIRTAKEEKEQVEKMKKATKEGTRVAGEKPDTTTGFEDDEYIPGIEMESRDDTMIADDTQVSATDMDDTPSGDDIFTTFFKSLGDVTFDEGFEVDDLNLKKGGAVEADFDGKDNDDEDEDEGDPPPLAKPEEVADDIPAMLSEGEYVLPANVVRYLGLERIMDMHQKVLHEIQQMEDLGMIQNVDENGKPENDDDEMKFIQPEGEVTETLIIAAKPQGMMCPPEMAEGGQINRDIDIDRTLDDDMLNIRSSIATQRSPTGFKTVFDPEVGFLKIKTPKGSLTVDKGAIDDFINQNEGPEGADPADPDVGGTASSFDVIGQSLQDIYSFEVDRAKDLMSMEQEQADTEKGMAEVDTDLQDQEQQTSDPAETGPAEAGEDEAELRSGGLMARFNTGGAVDYNIAGVGTVAGDMQLGDQLAAMEKPKTYEEIRADVLGDPLRDTPDLPEDYGNMKSENYIYKDNPVLEGSKLQTRKKRSSYVYDPSAGGGEGSNAYRNDKEVRQLLDLAGVDSEEYAFVMDGYNKGDEYLGGAISIKQNERLKKGLDALADKRRILKQGLKASDIPEGATNRDVFKKVFFNEIDYFGESLDPQNFEQPTQLNTVLDITDDELERLRSGKEAGTLDKKEREQIEFLDKFDLDAPAETGIVNQGISVLSGGRQGETFYDSFEQRSKRLKGPRSGIMGEGQYVEGVGYVT